MVSLLSAGIPGWRRRAFWRPLWTSFFPFGRTWKFVGQSLPNPRRRRTSTPFLPPGYTDLRWSTYPPCIAAVWYQPSVSWYALTVADFFLPMLQVPTALISIGSICNRVNQINRDSWGPCHSPFAVRQPRSCNVWKGQPLRVHDDQQNKN